MISILSQINPLNIVTHYRFMIHFNIILLLILGFLNGCFLSNISTTTLYPSSLPSVQHAVPNTAASIIIPNF